MNLGSLFGAASSPHRPRLARSRLAAVIALAVLAALAVAAAPVAATVIGRDHYEGTDAWSDDDCGFTEDVTASFHGSVHARVGKGDDASAYFGHEDFWFREVHVRRDGGSTLVISGHGLFQETRAIRVDGSVFEIRSVHAGQPLVITDGDGRVVARDSGNVVVTVLFDTLGDGVPGGSLVDVLSVRVAGPHTADGLDFCTLFD